jgi:hypothetical protein
VKNTRSDHRLQDNSLQARTVRWRAGDEHHPGYKEFRKITLINKPLLRGYISSHPTQDVILLIFCFSSSSYDIRMIIFEL